jgi:hypothetical protein
MFQKRGLEMYQWEGEGYQPLVFFDNWQVAVLNWEPIFDLKNLGEIERHNSTDEVFVLLKGKAVLFTLTADGRISVEDMHANKIYNVTQGSWHNLIATRDCRWIIVENRDTHLHDTEYRQLDEDERELLLALLPQWVQQNKEE